MPAIELIGGPLDGTIHEVAHGFAVPDRIGLPDKATNARHWYQVDAGRGTALYVESVTTIEPEGT